MFFIGLNPDTINVVSALYEAKYGVKTLPEQIIRKGQEVLSAEREFNRRAGIMPITRLPEFFEYEKLPPHNTVVDVSLEFKENGSIPLSGKEQHDDEERECNPKY